MLRQSWDEYFMSLAEHVSTRGTCDRKRVGAILVKDRRVLATGYNGSLAGLDHCDNIGHDIDGGSCQRTVHAEVNAVAQAARHGIATDGATCYCNTLCCWSCFKTLVSAGIREIVYRDGYRPQPRVFDAAALLGVTLREMDDK